MLLSRGFIYPFSPLFSRERTLFARGDRFSFLFFLLSLRPDRGQRGLLSFAACLLVSRCVSRGPAKDAGGLALAGRTGQQPDTLLGRADRGPAPLPQSGIELWGKRGGTVAIAPATAAFLLSFRASP